MDFSIPIFGLRGKSKCKQILFSTFFHSSCYWLSIELKNTHVLLIHWLIWVFPQNFFFRAKSFHENFLDIFYGRLNTESRILHNPFLTPLTITSTEDNPQLLINVQSCAAIDTACASLTHSQQLATGKSISGCSSSISNNTTAYCNTHVCVPLSAVRFSVKNTGLQSSLARTHVPSVRWLTENWGAKRALWAGTNERTNPTQVNLMTT